MSSFAVCRLYILFQATRFGVFVIKFKLRHLTSPVSDF